jgi:hypothetical protein
MWTGRIALLALLLLLCGGWFDALLPRWKKRTALLLLPVVLGLTFVPTLREPTVRLCFAPCALALASALLCPTEQPVGAAFSAVLGGVIGWKLCETFPLFFEQGLLIAGPTLLVSMLYCRDPNARALALAAAPFVMLLCRAGADYTLFKSAVLELGNEDALTAQCVGILLLLAGTAAARALRNGRVRIGKGIARRETT